jgi:hydroxymethylpyrimidine pyrophosphatase-like HAD family hydrolase
MEVEKELGRGVAMRHATPVVKPIAKEVVRPIVRQVVK